MWAQSASTNPAAGAADRAREGNRAGSNSVLSAAVGIEYGNIQEVWDFYDQLSRAFAKSDPGEDIGGPGQLPGDKPDFGIDLDDVWDMLNPEIQEKVASVASVVQTQVATLALIQAEGYGKAWWAADAPLVFENERWGGAWSMQLHWSATSRAFGLVEPIEFLEDEARAAIGEWFDEEVANRPATLDVGGQVRLFIDALGNVSLSLQNDSLVAAKAARLGAVSAGYSRAVWSGDGGTLYAGVEGHLYNLRLSRYGVRFGDITDSEVLFDEIRNADYETDTRVGLDLGVLWVGKNYQLGAQLRNINEPNFSFPVLELPIRDLDLIEALAQDRIYTMDLQLKLEASRFSANQRWSFHLAGDANAATDPVGNKFQWVTASAGYAVGKTWLPRIRLGYRKNLAGTKKTYLSLGATLFRYVNVDVSSAFDTTKIDGRKLPESVMASIGFNIAW
jgi:hypothetical protein